MAENKDKSPIVREHFELNIGNALKINGEVVSIEITSLEIKRELSGHSTLDMILYKKDEENLSALEPNNKIELFAHGRLEDNSFAEEQQIFRGLIEKVTFERERILVKGKSMSGLLDKSPIYRAYQNLHFEEQEIYNKIIEFYLKDNSAPKLDIILKRDDNAKGKNKSNEKELYIQFGETYWQFIKRIASLTELPIINKDIYQGPEEFIDLIIGFKDVDENSQKGKINYRIDKVKIKKIMELETYYVLSFNGFLSPGDYLTIDEGISGQEIRDYIVYKAIIKFNKANSGQVLEFEYFVKDKVAYKAKRIYNSNILGKSLVAKVVEQGNEGNKNNGKIALNFKFGDLYQEDPKENCSFIPYTSIHSSENTGSNMTPELGSLVNVYFPSEKEKDAFVKDSIIETYDTKYHDPSKKTFIIGKDEKSVGLIISEEGYLKIAGNNASTGEDSSVYLNVKDGGITIKADNDNVLLTLDKEKILIKNKDAQVLINDTLVKLQAGDKSIMEVQNGKMIVKSGSSSIEVAGSSVKIKSPKTEAGS